MKNIDKNALAYLDFRRFLRETLKKKSEKSKYSLRAFAHFLDIDAPTLQKIMQGKRPLGKKTIEKIGRRLNLSEEEIQKYVDVHAGRKRHGSSLKHENIELRFQRIDPQFFQMASRWQSYAVTCLFDIAGFHVSKESVSHALGLTSEAAADLLKDLVHADWIKENQDGGYTRNLDGGMTFDPLDPASAESRQKLMGSVIENSLHAFKTVPREYRSHYARTFSFRKELLPEVLAKFRVFATELQDYVESNVTEADEVYEMQFGVFPVTKFYADKS